MRKLRVESLLRCLEHYKTSWCLNSYLVSFDVAKSGVLRMMWRKAQGRTIKLCTVSVASKKEIKEHIFGVARENRDFSCIVWKPSSWNKFWPKTLIMCQWKAQTHFLKSYFFPKYLCTCGHIFSPDWKLKLAFDMKTLKFDEVGVQQIARNVSLQ